MADNEPQQEQQTKELTEDEKKKKKEEKEKAKALRMQQSKEKKKAKKEADKQKDEVVPQAQVKQAAPKKEEKNKEGIEIKKEENFADWYTQCITKSEMIEYYDISGCYILRPWSFQIWDLIRDFVDGEIKKLGVQNSYFPMFVKKKWLEMEKDHLEGFSPEVAWVTHSGDTPMAEPMAVRPTSETIMYPAYSNWIRSHRDLPLKLNQWCNVVRWEFKYPVPFIRSREFLWQEGHTAFSNLEEAEEEVLQILDIYRRVYEELLAVPVTPGKKTENEKFAGGHYTTTVEAFVPGVGRAVQGATSHCLGQNFSKMFNIRYESDDPVKGMQYVWQNSWGLTTRTIGVMVMVHGDNDGLVLPPRIAPVQVVIVPLYYKDVSGDVLNAKADEIAKALKAVGIRVTVDKRDQKKPGYKYAHWELRGVPVRLELGPKDISANTIVAARRDNKVKQTLALDTVVDGVKTLLDTIQSEMLGNARKVLDQRITKIINWNEFVPALDCGNIVLAPFCLEKHCEENIKQKSADESKKLAAEKSANQEDAAKSLTSAAKSLCIPFKQPELPQDCKCFCCGAAAQKWTLFGRSY